MTRRLSITILLTVWAAILSAGLSAWWTTRAVLVADLDQTIQRRAMMLPPEVAGRGGPPPAFEGDQYVIYDDRMHTIHPPPGPAGVAPPLIVKAEFTTLPEGRIRSLTLRFPGAAGGAP